jgi:hypothetical protein
VHEITLFCMKNIQTVMPTINKLIGGGIRQS